MEEEEKKKLIKEWDLLVLVYKDLNWNGKRVARKRMNKIMKLTKN